MQLLSNEQWAYIAHNQIWSQRIAHDLMGCVCWFVCLYRNDRSQLMLATAMNIELASGDDSVEEQIIDLDDNPELYALLDWNSWQFNESELLDLVMDCEIDTPKHEESCKPFYGWQWDFIAGSVSESPNQSPTATQTQKES